MGTSLIKVSTCTALVVYQGSPSLFLQIQAMQARIDNLYIEFHAVNDKIKFIEQDVPRITSVLAQNEVERVTQLNMLAEEIQRLEHGNLTPPTEDECKPKPMTLEEYKQQALTTQTAEMEDQQKKEGKEQGAQISVFRINNLAHPQRTNDPNLKEFYLVAKDNYEQNNLEGLKQLLQFLMSYLRAKKDPENLREFLVNRKKGLENVVQQAKDHIEELKNDKNAAIVFAFRAGNKKLAVELYRNALEENRLKLEARRNYLLSMIGLDHYRKPTYNSPANFVSFTKVFIR